MGRDPESRWLATVLIGAALPALGAGLIVMARLYTWALDQDWTTGSSLTPSLAPWTPALTFLAGAATAIFAEPIRRWVFRPVIEVSFDPATCVLLTSTGLATADGVYLGESQGRWVRVRVRTTRRRLVKGCRPHLINVEIEEQGQFRPSNFVDTLRLKWSSQPADEVTEPIDIPRDVAQFVDVLAADRNTPGTYALQAAIVPLYCKPLFDERPKTLRFTILVTSDEAKSARARFIYRWKGAWDTFEAHPG